MKSRILSLLACLSVVTLVASPARPNFIIIMADDLGYGDLGCYGGKLWPTPNLDRLAAEGMRFTDFHSSGAVCSPTRAGLLTGRYQQRAGIPGVIYAPFDRNRHHGLQLSEVTFAEVLKEAGYRTGMFGKWHLGYEEQYNPTYQGFERYVGYVSGNVDFHSHIDGAGVFDWWHQNKHVREPGYTTHLITRHAVEFVKAHRNEPFCVYVAHEAPHDPYQGPNDPPVRKEGDKKLIYNHREPKHAARAYREMMVELDKSVRDIRQAVMEAGIAERTLILFFSDNGATGPGTCGGLYGMKGTLWEGGHRVPCLAWWPGMIEAGTTSAELAFSIDVMPTLLAAAGIAEPTERRLDGSSLMSVLTGKGTLGARQLYWQYDDANAMRDGDWKLIVNGGRPNARALKFPNLSWQRPEDGRHELALFNLADDPNETRNVASSNGDRVAGMKQAIVRWEADVKSGAAVQPEKR